MILGGEMDREEITRHTISDFLKDEGTISISLDGAVEMQLDEIWMLD